MPRPAATRRSDEAWGPRLGRVGSWGRAGSDALHLARTLIEELQRQGVPPGEPLPDRGPVLPGDSRLGDDARRALERHAVTSTDPAVRYAFSYGKSLPDLLAARGQLPDGIDPVDAVVRPTTADAACALLASCAADGIAIVPVGGGSSVVGGIEPLRRNPDQPVVAIDTTGLAGVHGIDEGSLLAEVGAGTYGPRLEQELGRWQLTLGHIPQSFEQSTPGGWIAARSSGQQSLLVGRIEDLTAGLVLATADGLVTVGGLPAASEGPSLLEAILGSEGTMGLITSATLRVRPRPARMHFSSLVFRSFGEAADAIRALVRSGTRPAIVRASDATETAFSVFGALGDGNVRAVVERAARSTGYDEAALVTCISAGGHGEAQQVGSAAEALLRSHGGRPIGSRPARKWYASRFLQPYARDALLDAGYLIDTLETSVRWSRLERLHDDLSNALRAALGERSLVACHISHAYPDGASLYFTLAAPVPAGGDPLERWHAAKQAAAAVISAAGAAASHHHGIGSMHADILGQRIPDGPARRAHQSLRDALDPTRTCNPGKLLDGDVAGTPVNRVRLQAPPPGAR